VSRHRRIHVGTWLRQKGRRLPNDGQGGLLWHDEYRPRSWSSESEDRAPEKERAEWISVKVVRELAQVPVRYSTSTKPIARVLMTCRESRW
jgi:hypothetical protein